MSETIKPKVLTLDNIDIIKEYIDTSVNNVSNTLSETDKKWEDKYNTLTEEQQEKLNEKIEEAKNNLTERYEEKLANLESKINNATDEELSILINKIEILKSDFEQCNTALDKIKEDISDSSSIFNAAELDELINCTNIEGTYVDEDGNLNSEKILAKNITALVARFGTVKAESLTGDLIEGKTVVSLEKSPYSEKPMWGLYPGGSGHLAGGEINWDNSGNVTLGSNVKISWDNVTGKDDFLNEVINNYDNTIKEYVNNYINTEASEALAGALAEVELLRDEAKTAVDNLETVLNDQVNTINTTISGNKEDLEAKLKEARDEAYNNAINAVQDFQNGVFSTTISGLNTTLEATEKALEDAIAEGNADLIAKLGEVKGELAGKISTVVAEAAAATEAVVNLKYDVKEFEKSAVTKDEVDNLLAASLIETTEVTGDQISTPSLLAKKIVGLIATFGSVRASKFVGTHIQGYTVSAPTNMIDSDGNFIYEENSYECELDENGKPIQATDKDGNPLFETDSEGNKVPVYKYASAYNETTGKYEKIPKIAQKDPKDIAWQLNSDGSGWLANHNISWKQNGDITLSDKVTIKWGQVDGGQDAVDAAKTELNTAINNLNTNFGTQFNTTKQGLLVDAQSKVDEALTTASTNLNTVKTALEQKIGNSESSITTLTSELDNLSGEIDALEIVNTSIQSRLDEHDSVLSEENLKDIASAALIEGTTITGDSISAENAIATNIVGLVAKFGTIKSANIEGDNIKGKTIESSNIVKNTDYGNNGKPVWKIDNTGKITIIDELGNKTEYGGEKAIVFYGWDHDNEKEIVSAELDNSGLTYGKISVDDNAYYYHYGSDRISLCANENSVVISPQHSNAIFNIGDYNMMCDRNTGISLSHNTNGGIQIKEDCVLIDTQYTNNMPIIIKANSNKYITIKNDGNIQFTGFDAGYLYVGSDGILTTKTSTINPSLPLA